MDQVEIRSPKSKEEWKKYDDFRWKVLRKPIKMSHIPLKDNLEDSSYHYMIDPEPSFWIVIKHSRSVVKP